MFNCKTIFVFLSKPNSALNFSDFTKLTISNDFGKENSHGESGVWPWRPCVITVRIIYTWHVPGTREESSHVSQAREEVTLLHNAYHSSSRSFSKWGCLSSVLSDKPSALPPHLPLLWLHEHFTLEWMVFSALWEAHGILLCWLLFPSATSC